MHYSQVFHLHIPKTGGTSLNAWLESQFHIERVPDNQVIERQFDYPGRFSLHGFTEDFISHKCTSLASAYDFIGSHIDLSEYLPESFLRTTILRDPIARTFSQYRDTCRLDPADHPRIKPSNSRIIYNSRIASSFSSFAEVSYMEPCFIVDYCDSQCWALLKYSFSLQEFSKLSSSDRAHLAIERLSSKFNLYGITENVGPYFHELSRSLQLVAPLAPPWLNTTSTATLKSDYCELDIEVCRSLNQGDLLLYKFASSSSSFTSVTSHNLVSYIDERGKSSFPSLCPISIGPEYVYDMSMPFYGLGFSLRSSYLCDSLTRSIIRCDSSFLIPLKDISDRYLVRCYFKGVQDSALFYSLIISCNDAHVERVSFSYSLDALSCIEFIATEVERCCLVVEMSLPTSSLNDAESDLDPSHLPLYRYSYEVMST